MPTAHGRRALRRAKGGAARRRPPSVVLDMGERDRSVRAGQRIITRRIALEAEVVEAALLAVDVQLSGRYAHSPQETPSLTLAGPDVAMTPGTLLELHPFPHGVPP